MWGLDFTIETDDSFLFGKYTKKNNVSIVVYTNSYSMQTDGSFVNGSGVIIGKDKDVRNFIEDMKSDERVVALENEDNFAVFSVSEPPKVQAIFDSRFIFVKPPIFNFKGEYIFEIASINKKNLVELMNLLKSKNFKIRFKKLKKVKLSQIQTSYIYPNLSKKQKECFQLALNKGYYNYPKDITLNELADIIGISYSTFQFHLRQAEKKIMPFLNENI